MSSEDRSIRFRTGYSLREIDISATGGDSLKFVSITKPEVEVLIRPPTDEEAQTCRSTRTFCRAEMTSRVGEKEYSGFAKLAERHLPDGSPLENEINPEKYIDNDGNLSDVYILPLSVLPDPMQQALIQAESHLSTAVREIVGLVQWRFGVLGPRNPLASLMHEQQWSLDGENWHSAPFLGFVTVERKRSMTLSPSDQQEIRDLLASGTREPLGHELFREAYAQRSDNPRSALILAVAALEVGVKRLITDMCACAEWFVTEAQAPPVFTMLREYVPKLATKSAPAITKEQLDEVKKAVFERNRLVHRGEGGPSGERLDRRLGVIRDLLYTLDSMRGNEWAQDRLEDERPQWIRQH